MPAYINDFYSIKQTVYVSYEDISRNFCVGNSRQQQMLLETLAQDIETSMGKNGKWDMQCAAIARDTGWIPLNKDRLIHQLEVLVQHLKDSRNND